MLVQTSLDCLTQVVHSLFSPPHTVKFSNNHMFENAHNDNLEHLKSNYGNDIMSHWRTWHIILINTCVHVLKSWHRVRHSKYTSIYTWKRHSCHWHKLHLPCKSYFGVYRWNYCTPHKKLDKFTLLADWNMPPSTHDRCNVCQEKIRYD